MKAELCSAFIYLVFELSYLSLTLLYVLSKAYIAIYHKNKKENVQSTFSFL
jgi:hypothetical protein